jgi:hypothetical protein
VSKIWNWPASLLVPLNFAGQLEDTVKDLAGARIYWTANIAGNMNQRLAILKLISERPRNDSLWRRGFENSPGCV